MASDDAWVRIEAANTRSAASSSLASVVNGGGACRRPAWPSSLSLSSSSALSSSILTRLSDSSRARITRWLSAPKKQFKYKKKKKNKKKKKKNKKKQKKNSHQSSQQCEARHFIGFGWVSTMCVLGCPMCRAVQSRLELACEGALDLGAQLGHRAQSLLDRHTQRTMASVHVHALL